MKVFITGASGLVGGNILSYLKIQNNVECVGSYYSFSTLDTVYFDSLNVGQNSFDVEGFSPDYIIHCGALTNVDFCEENESISYEKTVVSTQNLLKTAKKTNSKFIYISTDYVFDGLSGPYNEDAIANPVNIYGKHKQIAEQLVAEHSPANVVVRITNVYGEEVRQKNFVSRLCLQAKSQETRVLQLPADQYATPINALDIARAIFLLMTQGKTGIYHLASTDYMNRCQLAKKVLEYCDNHRIEIQPTTTQELKQVANRPLWGGLKACKFLKEFPDFQFNNIDYYLKNIR